MALQSKTIKISMHKPRQRLIKSRILFKKMKTSRGCKLNMVYDSLKKLHITSPLLSKANKDVCGKYFILWFPYY